MYNNNITAQLIKSALSKPTSTDMAAAIHLVNNLGDAMNTPRVKAMPITTELDPLKYTTDITDKSIAGGKPKLTVNQADPAALSILLGRAANDYNRPVHPWDNLWNRGYTYGALSRTADILSGYGANKTSWKAIEKAYKDHPEIINDFDYLRSKLTGAKLKYDLASTLPGVLAGSYLGYRFFKNKLNPFSKKKHPILHYLTKGVKGMAGFALGNLYANAAMQMLGIPQYYKYMLDQTVKDPSYVYRSNRLNQNLDKIGRL